MQKKIPASAIHLGKRRAALTQSLVFDASGTIGKLEPGCRICGLTGGQFSLLDLLRAVLASTGPAHVTVSTWSTGIRDLEMAAWLLHSDVFLSFRILTDYSLRELNPKVGVRLTDLFDVESIRTTRTHAKFATIRNESWNIVVRSSMNLNRNHRWEQFDIDDDAAMADFFTHFVDDMFRVMPAGFSSSREASHGMRKLGRTVDAGMTGAQAAWAKAQEAVRLADPPRAIARDLGTLLDAVKDGKHAVVVEWASKLIKDHKHLIDHGTDPLGLAIAALGDS